MWHVGISQEGWCCTPLENHPRRASFQNALYQRLGFGWCDTWCVLYKGGASCDAPSSLNLRNFDGVWALWALANFELNFVAGTERVESYVHKLVRVEKEIFCLSFDCDEAKPLIRKRLDDSLLHNDWNGSTPDNYQVQVTEDESSTRNA